MIGSGYGGSILAARISQCLRPGKSICVLERGKEWTPGDFPETATELMSQISADGKNRQKLFNLKSFDSFSVLRGVGLGGGSLINANVAIKPDARIFNQNWPQDINLQTLDRHYRKAAATLRLSKGFDDENSSPKMDCLEDLGKRFEGVPGYRGYQRVNNTAFITKENIGRHRGSKQFQVQQAPCIMCGNCMSGCNVGAKNTLATSYLPLAKANGTKMFTGFEAERIEKDADFRYRIIGKLYRNGKAERKTIRANYVIVSAGTVGTSQLLLKSGSIPMSPMLGKKFNGNGDSLAMINNTGKRVNGVGYGTDPYCSIPKAANERAGLSILSALDFRDFEAAPFLLQDLNMPQGLGGILDGLTPLSPKRNMLGLLVMSEDTLKGRLSLDGAGRLRGRWPYETPQPLVDLLREKIITSPHRNLRFLSRGFLDSNLGDRLTAHPLGGACMADSPDEGVVDSCGRVFDFSTGNLHKGMYVADGSVIPSSLIANPLLTISALSEHIAEAFISDPANSQLFSG